MQRSRHPGGRDRRYLTALIGWGNQPSDVERLILAQPEAATEPTDEAEPTDDDPTDDDPTDDADSTDWWATAQPAED